MALASDQAVIGIARRFTAVGADPFDAVEWEVRDARLTDHRDGSVAFEQLGVEVPASWSQNATNILAQKYFRGTLGTEGRERSLRDVVGRIVGAITDWGRRDGYFADDEEAEAFGAELTHLLITQKAAFNSPVWFNIGVEGVPQQASACFILSVDDTMDSILNWYAEEGRIFKGGSGAGVNLSRIRASREPLQGGGTASGPVSFMRGADASAGTIKSGGKTRRAAKMVILDADHPDIEEFIWCKAKEERKARALEAAGFDMSLDGADIHSVQYQNANNSVRVTDEFMQAVVDDGDWDLIARQDGAVIETVRARDLFRQIADAAWQCADPGIQFDTTINRWHTAAATGPINASNPCFPGDTKVHTDKGLVAFRDLVDRLNHGEDFRVWTHDVTDPGKTRHAVELTSPDAVMITGANPLVRLEFANGAVVRATPNHRFWTMNRGWVRAEDLADDDAVCRLDLPTPAESADLAMPVAPDYDVWREQGDRRDALRLPAMWTEEFAHYLGWIVGDGSTSGVTTSAIYGSADDRVEIMPRHLDLLTDIVGTAPKPAEQSNGTVQLRCGRAPFKRFLEALGVKSVTGASKAVPWSIDEAPAEIAAAFLRGLFDADGCVRIDATKGSYVGLGSISIDLLRGVQRLLTTFGISSRIYAQQSAGTAVWTGLDGERREYSRSASWDLRISGPSIARYAAHIGFELSAKATKLGDVVATTGFYSTDTTTRLRSRVDAGVELTYNLSEPRNHSYIVDGFVVSNCSEYMHLDDSACNLASLNLMRFLTLGEDVHGFDVDGFAHAVRVLFTAQEILVGNADYPTPGIAETSRRFRQLGIGYANLGALLMTLGLPYDSDGGRAVAAAVTALMTGEAYRTSTRLAARMGPFEGFADNRDHMLGVLDLHRDAVAGIDEELAPGRILEAARAAWDDTCERARVVGVRNSQASVLAPTGTIGLLMDCDTTGVEPDLGLVKFKRLVGGGTMSFVNQSVPRALRNLGYDDEGIEAIVAHIAEYHSALGAPGLDPAHLPVFSCSLGADPIHHLGHVKMMGAVQPFISGAISKTVNLPESATIEEIELLLIESWRLGLKAVALYRDNCKVAQPMSTGNGGGEPVAQPMSTGNGGGEPVAQPVGVVERVVERVVHAPVRERLPRSRASRTFEFRVADCKGFVTIGEYDDGRPGEIFMRVSKQGSTLAGIMDAFAISLSHGLQYGVPLSAFVEAYVGMRFEPAGMTDDPDIRIANSLMDYLFRKLAVMYLSHDERVGLGILTTGERTQPTLPGVEEQVTLSAQGLDIPRDPAPGPARAVAADAPFCMTCGVPMQRAGACYVCGDCGTTSGCS